MKYLAGLNLYDDDKESSYLSLSNNEFSITSDISRAFISESPSEILSVMGKAKDRIKGLELAFTYPDVSEAELEEGLVENFIKWNSSKRYEEHNIQKLNMENKKLVDYSDVQNVLSILKEAYFACDYCCSLQNDLSSKKSEIDKNISKLEHLFESENILDKEEAYEAYIQFRRLRMERRSEKRLYAVSDLIKKYIDLGAMASFISYLEGYVNYKCSPDTKSAIQVELNRLKEQNLNAKK